MRTRLTFLILGASLALAGACGGGEQAKGGEAAPETTTSADAGQSDGKPTEAPGAEEGDGGGESSSVADPNAIVEELEGEVMKKPFSKSLESWNAGGADYYVLAVADPEALVGDQRTAEEGVILRPSKTVKYADLEAMIGKPVTVKGKFLLKKPYRPLPNEQVPEGVQNMEITSRGGGFQVAEISEK